MGSANDAGVELDLIASSDNVRLLIKRYFRSSNTRSTVFCFLQNITMLEYGRNGKKVFVGSTTQTAKLDSLDENGNCDHLFMEMAESSPVHFRKVASRVRTIY